MWHKYKNGNTLVMINDVNGTKIKRTEDDEFHAEFPESMDINLTQRCDNCCKYCYAECTPDGKHGDIMSAKFVDTLRPYTEAAIQANALDHPDLLAFLEKLKKRRVFPSITVNQKHFEQKEDFISDLIEKKLIYGVGISLVNPTAEFISRAQRYKNAVIHTIYGVTPMRDYVSLAGKGLKVLVLGYKDKGRGHDYLNAYGDKIRKEQRLVYDAMPMMISGDWYKVLSFDNLALEQLDMEKRISPEKWEHFYQGAEGTSSMFVDLVDETFGLSSLVPKSEMKSLMNDVVEMFNAIRTDV